MGNPVFKTPKFVAKYSETVEVPDVRNAYLIYPKNTSQEKLNRIFTEIKNNEYEEEVCLDGNKKYYVAALKHGMVDWACHKNCIIARNDDLEVTCDLFCHESEGPGDFQAKNLHLPGDCCIPLN